MKTVTDLNSSVNQRIKGKFVEREVKQCQTSLVERTLNSSDEIFTWDDVGNYYMEVCRNCGEIAEYCECDNQDIDTEPQDIMEWWLVTEWLYRKLGEKGEPILTDGQSYWWGRCATGQAILLDGVISEICSDMEILEGQRLEWKEGV